MADLRIFSYIPNPRLAKAMIAANFSGATIEVVGDKPLGLVDWLWDFDAKKLTPEEKDELSDIARTGTVGFAGVTLYKTDTFLRAHPFGSVPAGFSGDGDIGVFESNSIMRAAARLGDKPHGLLGSGPMGQSRVDGFLDRSLVFARDMQRYLLAGKNLTQEMHTEMRKSIISYATGLNTSLNYNAYLAGNELTLADIAATCELSQLTNESGFQDRLDELDLPALSLELSSFQGLGDHIKKLAQEPIIRQELGNYLAKLVEVWP